MPCAAERGGRKKRRRQEPRHDQPVPEHRAPGCSRRFVALGASGGVDPSEDRGLGVTSGSVIIERAEEAGDVFVGRHQALRSFR